MSTQELLFEYGRPHRGSLPAAMLIAVREQGSGVVNVELAVDAPGEAVAALVSPDGSMGFVWPLTEARSADGPFACTSLMLGLSEPGLIIEILDARRGPLPGMSCYVRLEPKGVFPIRRGSPGPEGEASAWGPKGACRFERAVNLVGAWAGERFVAIDLLVDDGGVASRISFKTRPPCDLSRAKLHPQTLSSARPSLARVWLPAGTSRIDLSFRDSRKQALAEYARSLDLLALPPLDPSTWIQALQGSVVERAPGIEVVASAPPEAGPIPLPVDTQGARALPDEVDVPAPAPVVPAAPAAVSFDAGRPWPDRVGADEPALGPPGTFTNRPALRLLDVSRLEPSGLRIDLLVDDHGLVADVAVAREGALVKIVPLSRLTPAGPVRVTVELAEDETDLVLACRNAYGEAFPNLCTAVDPDHRSFRPAALPRAVWGKAFSFTEPFDLSQTCCVSCRSQLGPGEGTRLTELDPIDRTALRVRFAFTPDARGLCEPCRLEQLSVWNWSVLSRRIASGFTPLPLLKSVISCYAGGLMALTPPAYYIVQVIRLSEEVLYLLLALAAALASGLVPWGRMARRVLTSTGMRLPRWLIRPFDHVIAPLALAGFVWLVALVGQTPLPMWYSATFFGRDLHVAAVCGTLLSLVTLVVMEAVREAQTYSRLERERRSAQVGRAGCLIPRFLGVASPTEYRKTLDQVLVEGLGALEYQVFVWDANRGKFVFERSVGPTTEAARAWAFHSGEAHPLGRAAELGVLEVAPPRPASGKVGGWAPPVTSVLILPITVDGSVREIYNVSRLRDADHLADLRSSIESLCMVAGRALAQVGPGTRRT